MSPEELVEVRRSWADLNHREAELVEHLQASFRSVDPPSLAAPRARWLVAAVADLVGLLAAPSRLGERALRHAVRWPVPGAAPSFRIEGQAWLRAAGDACPSWTDETERAWRQAWVLLSDVLAEESLSPFAAPGSAG